MCESEIMLYPVRPLIHEQRASDDSACERFINIARSKSIFEWFPVEIIEEILFWTSGPDPAAAGSGLYTMTRVSKTMSSLALHIFVKLNEHRLPKLALFHTWLGRQSFCLFPAWARSGKFAPREVLICHFSAHTTQREIAAIGVGLGHIRPKDRPRTVEIEGRLDVAQVLSVLDILGQSHTEIVQVDAFSLDWSNHEAEDSGTIRELPWTSTLEIEWLTLKPHNWRVLLRAISAPRLQVLKLEGDVPWRGLLSFLARHPTIKELHLPTSYITRTSVGISALQMPHLHRLQGKMAKVLSLLKIISRPASLSIDASLPSDTSLCHTVHNIVASLRAHDSNLSFTTNLTSTGPDGPLTKARQFSAQTMNKLRDNPDCLERLKILCLKVRGIDDEVLMVRVTLLLWLPTF